jgi:hypothetical protein
MSSWLSSLRPSPESSSPSRGRLIVQVSLNSLDFSFSPFPRSTVRGLSFARSLEPERFNQFIARGRSLTSELSKSPPLPDSTASSVPSPIVASSLSSSSSVRLSRRLLSFHVSSAPFLQFSSSPPVLSECLIIHNPHSHSVEFSFFLSSSEFSFSFSPSNFTISPCSGILQPFSSFELEVSYNPQLPGLHYQRWIIGLRPLESALPSEIPLICLGSCVLLDELALQRNESTREIKKLAHKTQEISLSLPGWKLIKSCANDDLIMRKAWFNANRTCVYLVYYHSQLLSAWLNLAHSALVLQLPETRLTTDWNLNVNQLERMIHQIPQRHKEKKTDLQSEFIRLLGLSACEPPMDKQRKQIARGLIIQLIQAMPRLAEARNSTDELSSSVSSRVSSCLFDLTAEFDSLAQPENSNAPPVESTNSIKSLALFRLRESRSDDHSKRFLFSWGGSSSVLLPGPFTTEELSARFDSQKSQQSLNYRAYQFNDPIASRNAAEEEAKKFALYKSHPLFSLSSFAVSCLCGSSEKILLIGATGDALMLSLALNESDSSLLSASSSDRKVTSASGSRSKAQASMKSPRGKENKEKERQNEINESSSVPISWNQQRVSALIGRQLIECWMGEKMVIGRSDREEFYLFDINNPDHLVNLTESAAARSIRSAITPSAPVQTQRPESRQAGKSKSSHVSSPDYPEVDCFYGSKIRSIVFGGNSRVPNAIAQNNPMLAIEVAIVLRDDGIVCSALFTGALEKNGTANCMMGVGGEGREKEKDKNENLFQVISSLHPTSLTRMFPAPLIPNIQVCSISAGFSHCLALTTNGALFVWGSSNEFGQLGSNDKKAKAIPSLLQWNENSKEKDKEKDKDKEQNKEWNKIRAIACGGFHSIIQSESGKLYSFGRGTEGQLGNGEASNKTEPQSILLSQDNNQPNIRSFHTGAFHSVILLENSPFFLSFGRSNSSLLPSSTDVASTSIDLSTSIPVSTSQAVALDWSSLTGLKTEVLASSLSSLTVAGEWNLGIRTSE